MKQNLAAPKGSTELQRNPRSVLHTALVVAAYLIAFIILDFISKQFEELPGVVAWYPPAGLTYALLLVFGVKFAPAVTIALFLSSLFIYRMPQPTYALFLWAFIISLIYSVAAAFLRKRIHVDGRLFKLRDLTWFIFTAVLVSTLLAVLSVSSSALSSDMPRSEVLSAIFNWWIGETVGVLTVTPFLLIFVMPGLKRFAEGQPFRLPARGSFPRLTLSAIGQAFSLAFVLYWVFVAPVPDMYKSLYFITLPLIWIALHRGFKWVTAAIMTLNFGVMLALWLFRLDIAKLDELQLLIIVNCIVGLFMGTVIIERKQTEETLRESDERYRALTEAAHDMIFVIDRAGLIEDVNDFAASQFQLLPEKIIGRPALSFFPPETDQRQQANMQKVFDSGQPLYTEYLTRLAEREVWLGTWLVPLIGESGQVRALLGVARDITDRKRAEQEVVNLAKFPSENPNPVLRLSRDGIVLYANPPSGALLRMWGCAVGDNAPQFWRDLAAQSLASKENKTVDYECDGKVYEMFITPIAEPAYVNLYGRNITQRKRGEEALRHSQEETTHANRLLLALSHAAQAVQRARTIEEVYSAIQEQVTQMGYSASGFELSEDGRSLRIAYLSYRADLVRKAEKTIGLSPRNFHFRPRVDSVYQKVIGKGETVFVENPAQAVADTIPKTLRALAQPMADLFKLGQSIFTPLKVGDKTIGLMAFTGPGLTEADNPAVTAFASQAAIAIQNAWLYEQAQQEIAERKQAEESLRESRQMLKTVLDTIPVRVFWKDTNSKYLGSNLPFARDAGLQSPDELVGKDDFQMIWREQAELYTVDDHSVMETGQSKLSYEEPQTQPDGSQFWLNTSKVPLRNAGGQIIGLLGTYQDITARKKAEEEIKISNDELSMLFELSHSLAEADNLDDILNLVNRHAVESIHTTFARIALLKDGKYIIRAAYPIRALDHDLGIGEQNPITTLPYSQRILERNEPMILRASDPEISSEEKKVLLLDFAQTLCLIPLRINDSSLMSEKLMGVLMLGEARNDGREPFTPEKVRLAQTIGDSAAIAIRRMLLHEQTERRLQQLIALSEIDLAIISNSDMVFSLEVLILQAMEQLKVDAAAVWLFNPTLQALEFVSGRGFRTLAFANAKPLHLGEGNAGRAALERRTIHIPNLTVGYENPRLAKALAEEPFMSYYAVPLIVKEQVKGILELFHRTELESNEEWLKFLHALANQAAIAIDNSSLFNDLQHSNIELTQAYDATIQGWSRALDLRDNETEGHTQRVTELTTKLGRLFGLSEEELIHVRRGALLHDIGKMGVPDRILLKPGPLTDEEWIVMRKHTTFAYELLSPIHYLQPALDIPYCHHEKWDGMGYPRGLKGEQIPLAARIFAVVDVWDALTSDRPYRAAWPEEKALDHIRGLAGTHFDPQVVKICLEPGLLKGHPKRRMRIEPVQWSEKFSVGVNELDQQHQQLIKLLNRLISATGTISTHTETISDILKEMTRYAQVHFKAEERLMEAYGFPGLEEQIIQHRDFRKKTVDFSISTTLGVEQIPEALLEYLADWLVHHILEDDMAYRSFFKDKGVD